MRRGQAARARATARRRRRGSRRWRSPPRPRAARAAGARSGPTAAARGRRRARRSSARGGRRATPAGRRPRRRSQIPSAPRSSARPVSRWSSRSSWPSRSPSSPCATGSPAALVARGCLRAHHARAPERVQLGDDPGVRQRGERHRRGERLEPDHPHAGADERHRVEQRPARARSGPSGAASAHRSAGATGPTASSGRAWLRLPLPAGDRAAQDHHVGVPRKLDARAWPCPARQEPCRCSRAPAARRTPAPPPRRRRRPPSVHSASVVCPVRSMRMSRAMELRIRRRDRPRAASSAAADIRAGRTAIEQRGLLPHTAGARARSCRYTARRLRRRRAARALPAIVRRPRIGRHAGLSSVTQCRPRSRGR